jgi:hypothetical protein
LPFPSSQIGNLATGYGDLEYPACHPIALATAICHHLIATFLPLANLRKLQMTSALQSQVFLTFATPPVIRAINDLNNPGPRKGNALYEVKR